MFTTLLSILLVIFSKFPQKIEAYQDEIGLISENDGKILLTDSRDDLMNYDSYHESGEFSRQNVGKNSEKKNVHSKMKNHECPSAKPYNRRAEILSDQSGSEDSHHDTSSWHFGYQNIDEWGEHFPDCLGQRQSPIDLNSFAMARLRVPSPFLWTGYTRTPKNMTIVNNGHTVELSGIWDDQGPPYISGGVLEDNYVFHQLHFHWGRRNEVGSEHTINNHSLPLEMHMVHYKKEYGSANEAMKHDDGLAVVGILFEISRWRNRGIAALQKNLGKIKNPGNPIKIRPFPLSIFKLNFPGEYVAYLGSLTTPPCSEIVTWIIPAVPRFASQSQLDNFRNIVLAGKDDHNYRPTMPLNGRMIYYVSI